ncbi:MAG: phosphoribosyltransferase [Bacteroidota bacterium]
MDKPPIIGKVFIGDDINKFIGQKLLLKSRGYPVNETVDFVKSYYDSVKKNFGGKISGNALLVPVPSGSGENIIPIIFSKLLKNDFKGLSILKAGFFKKLHFSEAKFMTEMSKRLNDPIRYEITNPALLKEAVKGKDIYIVDDIMATGESSIRLKKTLNSAGIKVNGFINFISVTKRYAEIKDMKRFYNKITGYIPGINSNQFKKDIYTFFNDYTNQKLNRVERRINNQDSAQKALSLITEGAKIERSLTLKLTKGLKICNN